MLLAFSVAPSGRPARTADDSPAGSAAVPADEASVHDAVAEAVRIVRESGLPNHTDSMFTTIEGEWDEVFDVVKRATEAVGRTAAGSPSSSRRTSGRAITGELTGKLDRLEQALGD